MKKNIYYGVGPTFQSHIAEHGYPQDGDFLFDTNDYGKKIKINDTTFTVLNPVENIEKLIKNQIIICSQDHEKNKRILK